MSKVVFVTQMPSSATSDGLEGMETRGWAEPYMVKSLDDIENNEKVVSNVWQTKRARELLKVMQDNNPNSYKLLLSEWSDGFDPNDMNKGNRGSVHIMSFSIFGKNGNNDPQLSFPASVCNDKSTKVEVRRKIYEDIEKLKEPTTFFIGEKMVTIQVILLVTMQDRKERSQATGFSYHNAKLGGRWGWVSAHDGAIMSCDKCYKHR